MMGQAAEARDLEAQIRAGWEGLFCDHADLGQTMAQHPAGLAYALAVIGTREENSITPPWVLRRYPETADVLRTLCGVPCREGCAYCRGRLDLHRGLQRYFGFREFRTYEGEPLQENAARAAMEGESLLAIFPTGGGKSITFQLPALLQGEAMHGLTVVISPLQSLMKDQVDHLSAMGITGAVTINGALSPIERADACARVLNGSACLLLISPEQLRSRTTEKLLESRTVVRFVIDEAHCFSAWGQDFRVDYLYIGDFIRMLQEKRSQQRPISVSCFTATAKQKVIQDIQDYFERKLHLRLRLFASRAERENLHYRVIFRETDQDKYDTIRQLVTEMDCPTIIYASRTRRTRELAEKLREDGFSARAYHGKMTSTEKTENQDAFLRNEIRIMVATAAFGMGVDKKDVGLVIHYDISDSLENYIQEAGRDPETRAECYVLFNNSDLDKHFILLNQTRLSISEIQQVWRAVKELTRGRANVQCSPLEIARQAGWETSGPEMETRVKTALAALENAGYLQRGQNVPHIYASGIRAESMAEAGERVRRSSLFTEEEKQTALRILQFLISRRSIARAGNDEAESRVDYISDILGLEKRRVIDTIHRLRQEGILADTQDMSAFLPRMESRKRTETNLRHFHALEDFLLNQVIGRPGPFELKKLNEAAEKQGLAGASVKNLRTILYYWDIKGLAQKKENRERDLVWLDWKMEETRVRTRQAIRYDLSKFALQALYEKAARLPLSEAELIPVSFSLVGLFRAYREGGAQTRMQLDTDLSLQDLEDALLYLSKIGALKLEGGFLVLYNGLQIHRKEMDNRVRYKQEDYRLLDAYYRQKIQQIHIVGEYANMMVKDYQAALGFVRDYFQMDYQGFIGKYFQGERQKEIIRNITPAKHRQLFGDLSPRQAEIIRDETSRILVVAAGPGSGKTRVLVHKLASLLLMEDVKHEQLLMLTFTRAAVTEFKKRLRELIGNAANFVEMKTFHSYCFDLLGRTGSLEDAGNVVASAVQRIENGEIEPARIRKTVLVIDEAQDMDRNEYALVRALMARNEVMRVIAVGDDDQNIYEFRGSSSDYLRELSWAPGAKLYEMTDNYRSLGAVVAMENAFAAQMAARMKSEPLHAVKEEAGRVQIIRYTGEVTFTEVIRQLAETWRGGSAALLTTTNEAALQLYTLLRRRGIPARLQQGMGGFSLLQLQEMRVLLNFLDSRLGERAVIPAEVWEQAKAEVERRCAGSTALPICRRLWQDFEQTNPGRYRTDLQLFIQESREEDFSEETRDCVQVSTIHRAKGKEYAQVYLALREGQEPTEEEKRRIYVGMSRAREELYIHCRRESFAFDLPKAAEQRKINSSDKMPEEVMLQLGHRDVVLSYFRSRERDTGLLRAGMDLSLEGSYLTAELRERRIRVAKLSKACVERFDALSAKGYVYKEGSIRCVAAWKPEAEAEECWVILPVVVWEKRKSQQLTQDQKRMLRGAEKE